MMLAPKRKGGKRKGSSVLRGREQKKNLLLSLALPGPFPSSAPGAKARKKKRNGKAQAARDSLFPATAYSVLSRVFISVGGREVEGAGAAAREARLWQTTNEMEPRRFSLSLFPDGRRTIPPRLCKLRKEERRKEGGRSERRRPPKRLSRTPGAEIKSHTEQKRQNGGGGGKGRLIAGALGGRRQLCNSCMFLLRRKDDSVALAGLLHFPANPTDLDFPPSACDGAVPIAVARAVASFRGLLYVGWYGTSFACGVFG